MAKEKVVLAYSGGLDTSIILKWLINEGYDVIAYVGNVGLDADFDEVEQKAYDTGASNVYIEDLREEFVTDYIFPALLGNAIYEDRYLLGTALARPLLAKRQIEIAEKEGAKYVSHGATGKGNDQVRFELSYKALNPDIEIISPWKNEKFLKQFEGRTDLLEYADKYDIEVKASKEKSYSEDDNLMHISHEAGILEDPSHKAPEHVFSRTNSPQDAPEEDENIKIEFEKGIPTKVTNLDTEDTKEEPLELFLYLNDLAKKHGIGRVDIVENRFVGVKSRGVYETPGATILWKAHRDLEGITMDREVMHIRDGLIPKFSEVIYNGLWFAPEMDFLMKTMKSSQENVTGSVELELYKGNVRVTGRQSPNSLYNEKLSSMDIEGGFDQQDSRGFININSIRLKAYSAIQKEKENQ